MEAIQNDIKKRLSQIIKSSGKSLNDISEDTKIPYQTLAGYAQGKKVPRKDTMNKLAKYLGVSVDFIMGIDEKKEFKLPEIINITQDYLVHRNEIRKKQCEYLEYSKKQGMDRQTYLDEMPEELKAYVGNDKLVIEESCAGAIFELLRIANFFTSSDIVTKDMSMNFENVISNLTRIAISSIKYGDAQKRLDINFSDVDANADLIKYNTERERAHANLNECFVDFVQSTRPENKPKPKTRTYKTKTPLHKLRHNINK